MGLPHLLACPCISVRQVWVWSQHLAWNKDLQSAAGGGRSTRGDGICSRSERMSNVLFITEAWYLQTWHYQELAMGCGQELD